MDDLYKYLNEIETDFSEYEDEVLSPEEVSRINSRINRKLNLRKKKANRTLTWVSRAAILTFCCLAVGGGVYAATTLRKNTANNLRIKSSQSEVVDVDSNKVTKKIYDEETGGELTYDVITEGTDATSTDATSILAQNAGPDLIEQIKKDGIANAEIASISKDYDTIKIGVKFTFDDSVDLEALKHDIETAVTESGCWSAEDCSGISLVAKLEDTEMMSWGNEYSIEEQTLYLDFFMSTDTTQAFMEGNDPNAPKRETPITANSSEEEVEDWANEWQEYKATLPDPLDSKITFDIDLGKHFGGKYTFTTKLDGEYEDTENERIAIDGGSGELDIYGTHETMTIDSYSIGANGLVLYGSSTDETDWDEVTRLDEEEGIEYCTFLRIRCWDDLGNTYVMYQCGDPDEVVEEKTHDDIKNDEDGFSFSLSGRFSAPLYDNASALPRLSEEAGVNYCSQWADGISTITFAIEKVIEVEDKNKGREVTTTVELISDPVTIDLK